MHDERCDAHERAELGPSSAVKGFLQSCGDAILSGWRHPSVAAPDTSVLLEGIGHVADEILSGTVWPVASEHACQRAVSRLCAANELPDVVAALSVLRGSLMVSWARQHGTDHAPGLHALMLAVDRLVAMCAELAAQQHAARQRAVEQLSNLSHELRNPLGTIMLGATMLLADAALPLRARRHLEIIQRAARRLSRVLDDIPVTQGNK